MDEENRLVPVPETQALTETEAETNALAPVALHELSTKLVAALDLIAANIPDLRKPHPSTAKKVRGARTVSREAVVSIVAMVEASATLQRLAVMDTERARGDAVEGRLPRPRRTDRDPPCAGQLHHRGAVGGGGQAGHAGISSRLRPGPGPR